MNRICKIGISECPGVDSPTLNMSSEAPDPLLFLGTYYPPFDPKCLGCDPRKIYSSNNCFGTVYSSVSQAEADLLARSAGAICKEPRAQQFTNDPQTASCNCPGGSVFSFTVPAGFVAIATDPDPAAWIAAANAAAMAYAEQQVANLERRDCAVTTSLLPHPGWMCLGEELLPGQANTYTITGLNAAGDWTFLISGGGLPSGVTLDKTSNNTAEIGGTPTLPGVYTYTILAFRPAMPGITVSVTDTLRVFGITNPDLPDATVGTPYLNGTDPVVILASGGTAPVVFSVDPSVLPVWITLADDGTITGTPGGGDAGVEGFDVTITDASGRVCTQSVTINVTSSCPDWTQLSWTTLVNGFHNGSSTILTPNNTTGASFHQRCSTPGWLFGFGPEAGAGTLATFTIPTTGGGCHCNLHLVYALTGILQAATLEVQIIPPGQAATTWLVPPNAAGTYDIPFTLNNPGNVTGQVNLQIAEQGFMPFVATTAFTIDLQGTFSNVP
jgi:hypothetical protein